MKVIPWDVYMLQRIENRRLESALSAWRIKLFSNREFHELEYLNAELRHKIVVFNHWKDMNCELRRVHEERV